MMEESENLAAETTTETAQAAEEEAAQTAEETAAEEAAHFAVPDAYKGERWAQNIKSVADLWKSYANAQPLIGKKSIPDAETASEADLKEFYARTRPKDAGEYSLNENDFEKEEAEAVRKTFFENGLNKKQAAAVVEQFKSLIKNNAEREFGGEALKNVLKETFGDGWEARTKEVTGFMKTALEKTDFDAVLKEMPNKGVGLLYAFADKMMKTYAAKESDLPTGPASSGGKMDFETYYKKMQEADRRPDGYAMKQELMKQYFGG